MRSLRPRDIVQQIKSRRISVLVSVPKILDVLREHVAREFPHAAVPDPGPMHWSKRWWKYRQVHRAFGWKFWAAVVGAAPLDPGLEEYWGRLGFLVVQGYGLTETAPIVTLNHPLKTRRGSVGKPIAGVEVKIAEDGEILVRGDNVTKGYYGAPEATARGLRGRLAAHRRHRRHRRAGPHLHQGPQEGDDRHARGAERLPRGRRARAHRDRRRAGTRRWSAGPGAARSASTRWSSARRSRRRSRRGRAARQPGARRSPEDPQRLGVAGRRAAAHRRHAQAETARGEALGRRRRDVDALPASADRRADTVLAAVQRFAPGRTDIGPDTTIEALGLSSLERVELLMALEEHAQTTIDESAFAEATTVADLARLAGEGAAGEAGSAGAVRPTSRGSRRPPRRSGGRQTSERARSPSPPGTGAGRSRGCGTSACRPGSCRSAAPSPG